jgi:hypothetical protein
LNEPASSGGIAGSGSSSGGTAGSSASNTGNAGNTGKMRKASGFGA